MTVSFSDWLEGLRLCGTQAGSDDNILCRNLYARLTAQTYRTQIPSKIRERYELTVESLFAAVRPDLRDDPKVLIGIHDRTIEVGGRELARKGGSPFVGHGALAKIYSENVLLERLLDITKTQKQLGIDPKPGIAQVPQILQALKHSRSSFVPKRGALLRGKLEFAVFATCNEIMTKRIDAIDREKGSAERERLCVNVLDSVGIPLSRSPTSYVAIRYPATLSPPLSRPTLMDAPADYLFVSQQAVPPHDRKYIDWGCASVSGIERERRLAGIVDVGKGDLRGLPEVVHEPCGFDQEFGIRFVGFLEGRIPENMVPDLTGDILQS